MINLKRKLLAAAMLGFVSVGGFAQKREDKRPPKDPEKVVEKPRGERPPPQNNNQEKKDKKGRP